MEYITTKDASAKWGISPTRITILANEGRIPGAQRLGKSWLIPANAPKPPERKANHSGRAKQPTSEFSFPLYHFRPDWSYIKESQLSKQQQQLLLAETAVMECRFEDAYPILESILHSPEDTITEIGCLWNAGVCCIGLNKLKEFYQTYLRLQLLLAEDFPHRDDLTIIFDGLKTYVETINSASQNYVYNTDVHEQSLPITCLLNGYATLAKEAMAPGSADTTMLELNIRLLKNTSATVVVEMMHVYLVGIYNLRHNIQAAEKHAKLAVQIAYESKIYFPLVTYFRYFTPILSPVIAQYSEEFQNHFNKLASKFEENYTTLLSSTNEYSVISRLTTEDQPYIYAILIDLPNSSIAERLGISPRTVKRRLDMICEKLGVNSKKELKEYLHTYM